MLSCTIILVVCLFLRGKELTPFTKDKTIFLKAFLPFGVILHHFFKYNEIPFLSTDTSNLGTYIVSVFFFISGYGLCFKYQKEPQSISWYYVGRSIIKLVIPLIVTTFFYFLCIVLCGGVYPSMSEIMANLKIGTTPLPYSWFIVTYIYLIIMYRLSVWFSPSKNICALVVLLFLFIVAESQVVNKSIPFHHYNMVLAFSGGVIYKKYEQYLISHIRK